MLLEFPVIVHTDHKNLICPTETSLRVKRWKLLLSEYRVKVATKKEMSAIELTRSHVWIMMRKVKMNVNTLKYYAWTRLIA